MPIKNEEKSQALKLKRMKHLRLTEDLLMTDEEEVKVTIEDLPGVGPATAEKLREAGFEEFLALAVMSPADLAEEAELGEAVAGKDHRCSEENGQHRGIRFW